MLVVSDLHMVGSALGKGQDTRQDTRGRVGPYRVIRRIGSGGMASVFEAEDEVLGQRVALKQLHPHIAERPGAAARFLREGRAAARVDHPHVVRVFSLGRSEDAPYLAMELLQGSDLAAILARDGRMPVDAALSLLLPVLAGVAAAHDAGVIHRDLKPSNVFIAAGARGQPCPKVVDFGVSKLLASGDARDLTGTDAVVGTAAYMAPEQARGVSHASFRSDQYALAVILYECVTGEMPFGGASLVEILQSLMTEPVVPPSQRVAGIPPAFDAIVLRAMSRVPTDRFHSVRALGAALLPVASERARSAWSIELTDRPEPPPPPSSGVLADDPGDVGGPPRSSRATLLTGTVRATVSGAPRSRRAMVLALAAAIGLVAAASLRLRAPLAAAPLAAPAVVSVPPRAVAAPAPGLAPSSLPAGEAAAEPAIAADGASRPSSASRAQARTEGAAGVPESDHGPSKPVANIVSNGILVPGAAPGTAPRRPARAPAPSAAS